MRPPAPSLRLPLRAAEGVLLGLLALGPLALGSAPAWALLPCCSLAFLALALALREARQQGQRLHLPLLSGVLALGAATAALQLVPVPPALLALLSPRAAETVDFALVPLGLSPLRPVSLDPPATWRALASGLAGLAVLLAASHLAATRDVRRRLLGGLALTGAGISLLGLLHWALGLEALLGFYRFRDAHPPLLTPFGNANHLAGFLGLTGAVGMGLSLSSRTRGRQVLWGSASFVCAVGVLASLSRGGILCWAAGHLLLGVLLWRRRRLQGMQAGRSVPLHLRAWVAVAFVTLLAGGGLYASERLASELATLGAEQGLLRDKLEFWPMFARAAGEFLPLGMGRGAFEAAFPRFQAERLSLTFTHPENVVLQAVAELGLPVGLALVLGACFCFVRVLRRPSLETTDLAVLTGVGALCLQNLVDFSLELPAVAFAALAAFGVLSRREEGATGWTLAPGPALGVTGALGAVALLALVPGRHTLAEAEEAVLAAVAEGQPPAQVRALAVRHIDLHPADHALYALAGHALVSRPEGDAREALAFASRALFLAPGSAYGHVTAARALLRMRQREQAFLEYRLAFEARPSGDVLAEAIGRARSVRELSLLTPEDVRRAEEVARRLQTAGRGTEAIAYLRELHERFAEAEPEGRARLLVAEARLQLAAGAQAAAAEACERAGTLAPGSLPVQLERAHVLRALGRPEEALALLETLAAHHPDSVDALLTLARHQLARRQPRLAREALARAQPYVSGFSERARLLDVEADVLEQERSLHSALAVRRTAQRMQPSAARAFALARLLERLERPDEALGALREGMALEPGGGSEQSRAWRARLEAAGGRPAVKGEALRSLLEAP